eukprot:1144937-Pelagomonas_calceolata.AAC.4
MQECTWESCLVTYHPSGYWYPVPIPIQEFTDDPRHRLRAVWRDVEGVKPRDTYRKPATYQSLFSVPFDHNVRAPARLPLHMHL